MSWVLMAVESGAADASMAGAAEASGVGAFPEAFPVASVIDVCVARHDAAMALESGAHVAAKTAIDAINFIEQFCCAIWAI
jgi:hypothetical protein